MRLGKVVTVLRCAAVCCLLVGAVCLLAAVAGAQTYGVFNTFQGENAFDWAGRGLEYSSSGLLMFGEPGFDAGALVDAGRIRAQDMSLIRVVQTGTAAKQYLGTRLGYQAPVTVPWLIPAQRKHVGLARGDFNGDGNEDLALSNAGIPDALRQLRGGCRIWFGPDLNPARVCDATVGVPIQSRAGRIHNDSAGTRLAAADADGDGKAELYLMAPNHLNADGAVVGAVYVVAGRQAWTALLEVGADQICWQGPGTYGDVEAIAASGHWLAIGRGGAAVGEKQQAGVVQVLRRE